MGEIVDSISRIQANSNYNISKLNADKKDSKSVSFSANKHVSYPSFSAAAPNITLRTELVSKEEKQKYADLTKVVDSKTRENLNILLKKGVLLDSNSNDKSTVLDNLYKIITTQRAPGLDPKNVIQETVTTLANPFIITQQFGNIPQQFYDKILEGEYKNPYPDNLLERKFVHDSINVTHSGDCVAASIEFNLANKMPAEFTRFAEGLTSPKVAVDKTIKLSNLTEKTVDAVWLLNAFEVPYTMGDFDTAKLTLAPDKNALIRAQIQNMDKDPLERSLIDALMQSTFMNVGSQQTYNTLTDIRGGKFNQDDRGLIEFEKTFTESVVEDKNKISVTYQTVDENGKIVGYETDFGTMKKQIIESLAMGENVIIGYTLTDETNEIINGHEITIIGVKKDPTNPDKLIFVCNDTDDDNPNPIEYPEDYIIPKIHHAGLPQKVAEKDTHFETTWANGLNAYKEAKANANS